MDNENQKIKAIFVSGAWCNGSGCNRFKWVSGITKPIRAEIEELEKIHGSLAILVPSHTGYLGQQFKLARRGVHAGYGNRFDHRQINDADYEIVAQS